MGTSDWKGSVANNGTVGLWLDEGAGVGGAESSTILTRIRRPGDLRFTATTAASSSSVVDFTFVTVVVVVILVTFDKTLQHVVVFINILVCPGRNTSCKNSRRTKQLVSFY